MKNSAKSVSNQANKIRAVVSQSTPDALERKATMPWEVEGEFEVDARVVSQDKGEILVRITKSGAQYYLTVKGFLPGKVNNQLWRLSCLRESGQIELLDGRPL